MKKHIIYEVIDPKYDDDGQLSKDQNCVCRHFCDTPEEVKEYMGLPENKEKVHMVASLSQVPARKLQ